MRILIHIALFAMLAGFLIPSIDGCCCNRFASCTGPDACNIFGCNCETYCYKGRCGYCPRCETKLDVLESGGVSFSLHPKINLKIPIIIGKTHPVALNSRNLECCGSGCDRRPRSRSYNNRRSLQDMRLVSIFSNFCGESILNFGVQTVNIIELIRLFFYQSRILNLQFLRQAERLRLPSSDYFCLTF